MDVRKNHSLDSFDFRILNRSRNGAFRTTETTPGVIKTGRR